MANSRAIASIGVLLWVLLAAPPLAGLGDPSDRPGCIPWLNAHPELVRETVTLDAMMITRILADGLRLADPLSPKAGVFVQAGADARRWQSVEVTGTLAENDGGSLYLANATVKAYLDSRGRAVC